jgi:hypothetical protein
MEEGRNQGVVCQKQQDRYGRENCQPPNQEQKENQGEISGQNTKSSALIKLAVVGGAAFRVAQNSGDEKAGQYEE